MGVVLQLSSTLRGDFHGPEAQEQYYLRFLVSEAFSKKFRISRNLGNFYSSLKDRSNSNCDSCGDAKFLELCYFCESCQYYVISTGFLLIEKKVRFAVCW